MMIHFELSTRIYRPLNQVFAFVAMPENDFQWQYGTLTCTQISHGEIGIGTLFRAVGHLMGRRLETIYEVTVFDLNNRYGFKSISGSTASNMLYSFEIAGGCTKVNMNTEMCPVDVLKPGETMIVKKLKKEYKENLAMLKNLLEGHPTEKM
jgi:hypothetical protein